MRSHAAAVELRKAGRVKGFLRSKTTRIVSGPLRGFCNSTVTQTKHLSSYEDALDNVNFQLYSAVNMNEE